MKTLSDLIDFASEQLKPFSEGHLADDWEERSMKLSAISDYLLLRNRDDAFVRNNAGLALEMYSSTGYRQSAAKDLLAFTSNSEDTPKIIPLEIELSDRDREILINLCKPQDLDYGEKIVMAATAHAMCNIEMPLDTFSDLANIFFEEAYHLRIVDDIVGYGLADRAFIPESRQHHWNLVKETSNAFEYVLLEHVLYEGRGTLASAYGVHQCISHGVSEGGVEWFAKIARQEANHAICGFFWIERLCDTRKIPETSHALLRHFIETECADGATGFRAKRLKFSCYLLDCYRRGRQVPEIVTTIKNNVMEVIETGNLLISPDEIDRGVDDLYKSCLR